MNVLYATDGSKDAIAAGELLLQFDWGPEDSLTTLSVIQNYVPLTGRVDSGSEGWQNVLGDEEARTARRIASEAADRLAPHFESAESRVYIGFAAQEILRAAGEIQADLIVVGSQGRSALKEWFVGSVSHAVMEKAGCSVLAGRALDGPLSGIALAYDGSSEAEAALEWVRRLPLHRNVSVEVISVAEPVSSTGYGLVASWPVGHETLYNDIVGVRRDAAERLADTAANGLQADGFPAYAHTCVGDPIHEIVRLTKEWATRLVILGAHSHGGRIQDLLGNTPRAILKATSCSVLVARSGKAQPQEHWDLEEAATAR
jgi:nucleotide-binding universal stress UspA family protein